MKHAEEIIAGFYHHIKNTEVQDKRNNEAYIHKLNYIILFNPTPNVQDWISSMVSFAAQSTNAVGQTEITDEQSHQLNHIIDVLRNHYNSIVTENKMLTAAMFESELRKQQSLSTQDNAY